VKRIRECNVGDSKFQFYKEVKRIRECNVGDSKLKFQNKNSKIPNSKNGTIKEYIHSVIAKNFSNQTIYYEKKPTSIHL